MKKYEKEVLQSRLDAEEKEMKYLKAIYKKVAEDISEKIQISNGKINVLLKDFDKLDETQRSILQSQIYQRNFQQSLKKQIDSFIKELESKQYKSITDYMNDCYKKGFIGAMYSLHKQGIPLIMPIDQKKVVKAMFTDSKISKKLYTKLGEDINSLKKRIAGSLARGIASADSYANIARNIASDSNVGFNRAMRIARTEGTRISNESAFDASKEAANAGSDVAKQWSAALDSRTRETHAMCDGEIVELDETFSNGLEYPGDPAGGAEEVINCRCALLQRAKWALDEDELQTLKDRAEYFGLDKAADFRAFERTYLNVDTVIKSVLADFALEKSPNSKNFVNEQITIAQALENTPKKVLEAMKTTKFVIGGAGSAYDYTRDIMYIASGARIDEVYHEIGHLVEAKLMDKKKVNELKKELFKNSEFSDIIAKTMHKTNDDPVDVFIVKNEKLVSEYQGRIYVADLDSAFDKNGEIRVDRLLEFISEPYREYMENPKSFKEKYPDFYELLKGVFENGS